MSVHMECGPLPAVNANCEPTDVESDHGHVFILRSTTIRGNKLFFVRYRVQQ
jgi:hypothetical protein